MVVEFFYGQSSIAEFFVQADNIDGAWKCVKTRK